MVPTQGASNNSFIVAGHDNTTHTVTPGKGGSLKCDRACVNFSTNICKHVLAAEQVRDSFQEFLSWYKLSKKGPQLLEIALGSCPKNVGKKPSRRKRTSKQKPEVTNVVDLLEQRTFPEQFLVPAPSFRPNAMPVSPQAAPVTENVPSAPSITLPPVSASTICNLPASVLPSPQIHQPIQINVGCYIPEIVRYPEASPRASTTPANSGQLNSFWLKWLPGTRVSRCYGCNREIRNPPDSVPDDLIVAYRDIRQYTERNTGEIQF